MRNIFILAVAVLGFAFVGCTVYVRPAPPPARVEVKPAKPYKRAAWVQGHWVWKNKRVGYIWVPGHWARR